MTAFAWKLGPRVLARGSRAEPDDLLQSKARCIVRTTWRETMKKKKTIIVKLDYEAQKVLNENLDAMISTYKFGLH